MRNTFKRIVALTLTALMCISLITPVFAAKVACPGAGSTHTAYNCRYVTLLKQEATCTTEGLVTGRCKTCAAVFTISQTDALGHEWKDSVGDLNLKRV